MVPSATYRVQFHAGFPFSAAIPLAGYWKRLGISHLYASPIATSRKGSNHGYDVVDPTRINPELGGETGFRALAQALKDVGIGIILDIVPNHLAVGDGDNAWWQDVLHKGRASAYAHVFDIDWDVYGGKILAPVLGAPYAEALASGDLAIARRDGRLAVVTSGEHVFPLRPEDQDLADTALTGEALHALCERQHWRLAWYRTAGDAINWRRFFNITELAGVRVEDEAVFEALHALPVRLYRGGLIDGVRVDHIDGLSDPAGYGRRLRAALGPDAYIVVEKILAHGESLPTDWDIDGTTGYDFLNAVCAVLHDPAGAEPLGALWAALSGRSANFASEADAARRELLDRVFAGQLDACAQAFRRVALSDLATRDWPVPALRRASRWLLEAIDGYRTYGGRSPALEAAIEAAVAVAGPIEAGSVQQVGRWLAGEGPGDAGLQADALRRFSQLAAPVAAKSIEDTAFYRYGRLLSRNDVGCDPGRLGEGAAGFLAEAAARPPHAMLATATHDHKRGEDVRARLAVLSEIPQRWAELATAWSADAPDHGVDRADATMLHQMIVGAWPLDLGVADREALDAYGERLAAWQLKALREAKLRTSWACPDEVYEARCEAYLRGQLAGERVQALQAFALEIAPAGFAKSLVQVGLRCTLPGAPDLFQGREGWDLSLVDPDNRTPVDYDALMAMLDRGEADWRDGSAKQQLIAGLLAERPRGTLTPLSLTGARAGDALAFRRGSLLVIAAIRGAAACMARGLPGPGCAWWGDTAVLLDGAKMRAADLAGEGAFGWRRLSA